MLNWAMGTKEAFAKDPVNIIVNDGDAKFDIPKQTSETDLMIVTETQYVVHIDLYPEKLGAIARARPGIEIISQDELAFIQAIYGYQGE